MFSDKVLSRYGFAKDRVIRLDTKVSVTPRTSTLWRVLRLCADFFVLSVTWLIDVFAVSVEDSWIPALAPMEAIPILIPPFPSTCQFFVLEDDRVTFSASLSIVVLSTDVSSSAESTVDCSKTR